MPVFNVKIRVSEYVEIPVYAENEKEAEDYVKSTYEWKDDGSFDMMREYLIERIRDRDYDFFSLEEITDLKNTKYPATTLCWNDGGAEEEIELLIKYRTLRALYDATLPKVD